MAQSKDKFLIGIILILALLLAISLAVGAKIDFSKIKNWQLRFSDLITSPIARKLANEETAPQSVDRGQAASTTQTAPAAVEIAQTGSDIIPAPTQLAVPPKPTTGPDDIDAGDIIMIPKIDVAAPLIAPQTYNAVALKKLLDEGAVIYPSSGGFGNNGQTVIMGHSAPVGWPEIKHDTIFSRLTELAAGDEVIAFYRGKTYNYSVLERQIVAKGSQIPEIENATSSLALVTCWPPGRDLKRLLILANLESIE